MDALQHLNLKLWPQDPQDVLKPADNATERVRDDASQPRLSDQLHLLPQDRSVTLPGASSEADSKEWFLGTAGMHSTAPRIPVFSLPLRLAKSLAVIPTIVDVPDDQHMTLFSRQFLAKHLGGGVQSLINK